MSGWYIMHRGWMDSFKPEPFTEREAFLWSIERAAIKAHDQWFNGQRIAVARGEFATSLRQMAEAFQWSVKRIRGFMDRMGKAQKWAQRQAHQGAQSPTIITVCNYDFYQNPEGSEGAAEGTVEGTRGAQQGHSKGTQQNKGNKGNKGKKKDKSPSDSSISDPDPPPAAEQQALLPALVDEPDDAQIAFDRHDALRREFTPGARSVDLTPQRRTKLAARLKEIGGLSAWDEVLAIIRASPFLRGETSRNGFVPTIDWITKPENLRKVNEGNYDHGTQPRFDGNSGRGPNVSRRSIDAVSEALALSGLMRHPGGFDP